MLDMFSALEYISHGPNEVPVKRDNEQKGRASDFPLAKEDNSVK